MADPVSMVATVVGVASLAIQSTNLVAVYRVPVRHEILIQSINCLHISLINFEPADIAIVYDALLGDALWKRHKSMLHTPPDHELSGRT